MAEKNEDKTLTFEKALARLETLVRDMEGGTLSLEKMMAHFEEGGRLVAYCTAKLNEVEQKIELLVKKDGAVAAEPFAPGGAAGDARDA